MGTFSKIYRPTAEWWWSRIATFASNNLNIWNIGNETPPPFVSVLIVAVFSPRMCYSGLAGWQGTGESQGSRRNTILKSNCVTLLPQRADATHKRYIDTVHRLHNLIWLVPVDLCSSDVMSVGTWEEMINLPLLWLKIVEIEDSDSGHENIVLQDESTVGGKPPHVFVSLSTGLTYWHCLQKYINLGHFTDVWEQFFNDS